jgi:hypothetical protein
MRCQSLVIPSWSFRDLQRILLYIYLLSNFFIRLLCKFWTYFNVKAKKNIIFCWIPIFFYQLPHDFNCFIVECIFNFHFQQIPILSIENVRYSIFFVLQANYMFAWPAQLLLLSKFSSKVLSIRLPKWKYLKYYKH